MQVFKINRVKSEAPLIAVFAVFGIMISLIFYPQIRAYSFLIFPMMILAYYFLRANRLGIFGKECFMIVDDEGMRYCLHLFQHARLLKWAQVEIVNFQMYEINFKLKESGLMINIQTSYLSDTDDMQELKTMITSYCKTA